MESEWASAASLPGRILIVEDDRQILAILSLLLEDEGYEIQTATDGKQALARLRDGPSPDLIILDLMLPSLDGWEFRTIQRADPTLSRIPVLAVSADSSAKAQAIDATSFLRKPFGAEDLLARVHKILSDRVRMEARMAETERLVALGRLTAEATHEMSNPLGSVVANVASIEAMIQRMNGIVDELRRRSEPSDEAQLDSGKATVGDMAETVRDIRVGTDRMARALDDLRGKRTGEHPFGAVDIRAVLEAAIALTAHLIRDRAILTTDFAGPPPAVRGNEFRLGQLFTNLLTNAAHAIAPGDPTAHLIRIGVFPGPHDLTVEISDSGQGMTPEVRAHLFEPFFTTKPAGQGTGLGLPICLTIAQEHLGGIEVKSEPGKGSTFRVKLPLDRARLADTPAPQALSAAAKSSIHVPPQAMRLNGAPAGPRRPG
jgi:signal transduction histidine kinase